MKRKVAITVICVFGIVGLMSCYFMGRSNGSEFGEQVAMTAPLPPIVESKDHSVIVIPLNGPITNKDAELSGLAWAGDTLVLLPQYPEKFGPGDGVLFAISKSEILDYLNGDSKGPITPSLINLIAPDLRDGIKKYEGFEAIDFLDQTVYMTIESGKDDKMMGYLVSGSISAEFKELRIDTSRVVNIPPAIKLDNRTDEALVVMQDQILTFFEINGASLNPQPAAHVYGLDLTPKGTILFPKLEYRVTDATLGPDGEIWVINYVSPKDSEIYPRFDPLAEKYGGGEPPDRNRQVERLVKLNLTDAGLILADQAPLQIRLIDNPRNWEGLVLLDDRGFLLVTDKSPGTILGFIPMP